MVSGWAVKDISATVEWLEKHFDNPESDSGVKLALNLWGREDKVEAAAYLDSMKSSTVKDSALAGFAERKDPRAAADRATTIADSSLRLETLLKCCVKLPKETLLSWLEGSNLNKVKQDSIDMKFIEVI